MDLIPRKWYFDDMFDDLMVKDNAKCDIYEKKGEYHIEMDVPGYKKEDIKISHENGYLTISAEKKHKDEEHDKKYLRRERSYSKFERSFYLGDADEEKIEAEYTDGTLHIIVPKKNDINNKKYIDIK